MHILVTGGAGFIGSHICVELLREGYQVTVVDNLVNSKRESLERVQRITGRALEFHQIDLRDEDSLGMLFARASFDAAIHLAGFKSVDESVLRPLDTYHNNLIGTLILCRFMNQYGVKRLVFSSSATVYGAPERFPITEDSDLSPTNPYGRSKLMIEQLLQDIVVSDREWRVVVLRYFNPVGAHPSGRIGEDPRSAPTNLLPYIAQVAVGRLPELRIFGSDYPTPDGTGVRDYIHVVDLAQGHLKALEKLMDSPGVQIFNLGTGRGYSVLEVMEAFEKVSGEKIPHRFVSRRPGDAPVSYADPSRAEAELGWVAQRGLEQMCRDIWRWQSNNPDGYDSTQQVERKGQAPVIPPQR